MPKKIPLDSRGLPEGMDPLKFYEYRTLERANKAEGIEAFLYRLMGPDLIRSFAIAIDPFYKIRTQSAPITPPNRKRTRRLSAYFDQGTWSSYSNTWVDQSVQNYLGIPGCVGPVERYPGVLGRGSGKLTGQLSFDQYSIDTTRSTRIQDSEYGEFEKFKYAIFSPGRTVRSSTVRKRRYDVFEPPPSFPDRWYNQYSYGERRSETYSAIIRGSNFNSLVKNEKTYATGLIQKHALPMFRGLNPTNRGYTFFRNLVELRDLPRSILDLKNGLQNLAELERSLSDGSLKKRIFSLSEVLHDIPQHYVGYHFGWKQLYRDVTDLLSYPEAITKKFNFLLRRSGKDTTLRSKRTFLSSTPGIPGFEYFVHSTLEKQPVTQSRLERNAELRVVINTRFDFPPLDELRFRRLKFGDYLGVVPRPSDLYNLVPWTWLVDWFSGFGDYIQVIENSYLDTNLINYGFITYASKCKLITDYRSYTEHEETFQHNTNVITNISKEYCNHTSVLDYSFQLRKDLSSVFDVGSLTDTSSLNEYQKSILLSILLQKDSISGRSR